MISKMQLNNTLKRAMIDRRGTLLVHASMKSIGEVEGGAEGVLDVLCKYMEPGLLVIPCHTWANVNTQNPIFDVEASPSCIGLLPELFRKRKGVLRSLHPTHSLCAKGVEAESFLSGQELFNTPCAPESCYSELAKRNAQVLMIGVNFSCNTSVHCIEEIACVPNRIKTTSEIFTVIDQNKNEIKCPSFRHDNANSNTYVKLEPVMKARGQLLTIKFGDASCLFFEQKKLFQTTLELLEKDIHLLDDDKPIDPRLY